MNADMRLSDAERDDAINVLSEHVQTGRLDVEEFGTRSAKVSTAKTRSELVPLFADLPAPHPGVLTVRAKPAPPAPRYNVSLVPIAAIVALLLYFTVARGVWLVFLLPVAVAFIFAGRKR